MHLKRVLSWCTRFVDNCRSPRNHSSQLSLEELQSTETRLLKLSQERSFKADYASLLATGRVSGKSSIRHLQPYLDEKGLIRVGGRLEKSALSVSQKHPVILHQSDRLSKLICGQLHVDNLHVGPTALLAVLSLQFHLGSNIWQRVFRGVVSAAGRPIQWTSTQLMGQLPAIRVTLTSPFHHTGADLFRSCPRSLN